MTLQDIRDLIKSHTIGTVNGSVIISDTQADVFIGTALDRMLNDHDWKFQEVSSALFTYTTADDGVALPGDFIQEQAVYALNTDAVPANRRATIPKVDGGRAQWVSASNAQGTELFPAPPFTGFGYYIFAQALYIVPQPDTTLPLQMDYLSDVGVLSDLNPFVRLFPRALLSGAVQQAYLWLHEDERAAVHESNFTAQMAAAKKRDIGQRMSGGPKVRGV